MKMMLLAFVLLSLLPDHVYGQPNRTPIVIELFTSEGCSSCPPADRLLSELISEKQEDVEIIALSFHVDYWDYIGWKDPYASQVFTDRQRMYSTKLATHQVYTPQMIANGQLVFVGSDRRALRASIEKLKHINIREALKIGSYKLSESSVGFTIKSAVEGKHTLNMAIVERNLSQKVNKGENRGRLLNHDNVVRNFKSIEFLKSGKYHLELPEDLALDQASLIVYLQDRSFQVLGADQVDLAP